MVRIPARTAVRVAAHRCAQVLDSGRVCRLGHPLGGFDRDRAHLDERGPRSRAGENAVRAEQDVIDGAVVREGGHTDVRLDERVRRGCEHGRAALPERLGASRGAVEDGERVARVEDPLGDRLAHLPEANDCDPRLRHNACQPPSITRLIAFAPPFSSRKSDAPMISSIVTVRPMRVRAAARSTISVFGAHSGESPTIPG